MAYVALDYGHGENTFNDKGSKGVRRGGKSYEEHHFNADVGERVKAILERHGVRVLVTQPPYKRDVGLNYRTNLANRHKVDAFVSLHANAGSANISGSCVFAWKGFDKTNRLADYVVDEFKKQGINLHGNGRHYSESGEWTDFHVLRETDMSAILIEHGFMTNDEDFENIFGKNKEVYREKCAVADAKAILRWFGIPYKGEIKAQSKEVKKVDYTDQTGFKDVNPNDEEFAKAAEFLKENEIMVGYGDGTFRGHQNLTRKEFGLALYRAFNK